MEGGCSDVDPSTGRHSRGGEFVSVFSRGAEKWSVGVGGLWSVLAVVMLSWKGSALLTSMSCARSVCPEDPAVDGCVDVKTSATLAARTCRESATKSTSAVSSSCSSGGEDCGKGVVAAPGVR